MYVSFSSGSRCSFVHYFTPRAARSPADIFPLIENANDDDQAMQQSSPKLPSILCCKMHSSSKYGHCIILWAPCPHKLWKSPDFGIFWWHAWHVRAEGTIFYFSVSSISYPFLFFVFLKVKYPALFTMYSLLWQTKQMSKQCLFALLVCQCEWICHFCLLADVQSKL